MRIITIVLGPRLPLRVHALEGAVGEEGAGMLGHPVDQVAAELLDPHVRTVGGHRLLPFGTGGRGSGIFQISCV